MSYSFDLEHIISLLEQDKAEEARVAFNGLPEFDSVEYFLVKGKIEQKFQKWGDAINAYNRVLTKEPDNESAKSNLELIQNILNFWNPEMFNP